MSTVIRSVSPVASRPGDGPVLCVATDAGTYLTSADSPLIGRMELHGRPGTRCELELDDEGRVRRILPTKAEIDRQFAERVNDLMNGE